MGDLGRFSAGSLGIRSVSFWAMARPIPIVDFANAGAPRSLVAVALAIAQFLLLLPFPVLLQPCRCADDRENGCRCADHDGSCEAEPSSCCAGHSTNEHACCQAAKPKSNLLISAAKCGGRRIVLGFCAEVVIAPTLPITLLFEVVSSPGEPLSNEVPLTTVLESIDPPPRTS